MMNRRSVDAGPPARMPGRSRVLAGLVLAVESRAVARAACLAALAVIGVGLVTFWMHNGPGDAFVYLAAGERLNAGHPLYALSPGDRIVSDLWVYPLLSPPLIAVAWRPLALFGDPAVWTWAAGGVAAFGAAMTPILRSRPLIGSMCLIALSVGVVNHLGWGNVAPYLFAGAYLSYARPGRPWVGAAVGLMAAIKLVPIVLIGYLIGQRNWRGVAVAVVALGACALVSLAGAGWANHAAYLQVVASVAPSEGSLGDITGLSWAPMALLLLAGVICAITGWWWPIPIALTFGTPAFYVSNLAFLLLGIPSLGGMLQHLTRVSRGGGATIARRKLGVASPSEGRAPGSGSAP